MQGIGNSSKTVLIVLEESVADAGVPGGRKQLPD